MKRGQPAASSRMAGSGADAAAAPADILSGGIAPVSDASYPTISGVSNNGP